MPEAVSEQTRQAVNEYLRRDWTNKMIQDETSLTRLHIRKLRKNWTTTGDCVVHTEPPGRPKKLQEEHEKAIRRFIARKPNAYHEEIVEFLADAFDVKTHQSTISRTLKKLGIVRYHEKRDEDGHVKLLKGPGPRPSMLVDVRHIDPALQYSSPYSAPPPPRSPSPSAELRSPENHHSGSNASPASKPHRGDHPNQSGHARATEGPRPQDLPNGPFYQRDPQPSEEAHPPQDNHPLANAQEPGSILSPQSPSTNNAASGIVNKNTSNIR